ncbi:hypothetical protein, partial [Micromonospora maritima]
MTVVPKVDLGRCGIVFRPDDPPRAGTLVCYDPAGDALPQAYDALGQRRELTLALPLDGPVEAWHVPVVAVPVGTALSRL